MQHFIQGGNFNADPPAQGAPRATHDGAVWAHLAGDTSAPLAAAVERHRVGHTRIGIST